VTTTHYRSCNLCEATCGVAIEVDGDRVVGVRGDDADPFSRGYICPKGAALADLHHDPDRLRTPMRRDGETWRAIGWDEALDYTASRLREIRARHGADSVATYQGNPTAHNLGLLTYGQLLLRTFGSRNQYSAFSLDSLPHMLAAMQMFGSQLLMPVPDIDRTELMICLGANPLASNGSIMTAPDVKSRLKAIRDRGGRVIVLDPRKTETAEKADRHLFIRPATDAVLLLAMIHVLFAENRVRLGRLQATGVDALRALVQVWTPERAEPITGVRADDIRDLARALATTEKAVLYGRLGVCVQEFGGLAAWLCYTINALTGHLDEPGGLMFTTPALDPMPLAGLLGLQGSFARWTSRVSGKPEFGGELPMTAFAEEITTPGAGQIRALLTIAGNPALSAPGGPTLERALGSLEFMVSIDPYLNETTRLAHVILPPTSVLERSHYDAALFTLAVRNVAKYSAPLFPRAATERHDWEICLGLLTRLKLPSIGRGLAERLLGTLGPEAIVDLGLRTGPYGVLKKGLGGLSLAKLRANPHGIDLGPLESRLPKRLATPDKKVQLAPATYINDLPRLEQVFAQPRSELVMIGRRHMRSNNSWMHNSERLVKGPSRCTLMIHPDDAATRGVVDGGSARITTALGAIEVPVEVTESIMRGVVSVPHGWGHNRRGAKLSVAEATPGASVNDVIDPTRIDALTGTSALSGQPVEVTPA
jgi:anaerobic selenocysteine-containing dehydrogenase